MTADEIAAVATRAGNGSAGPWLAAYVNGGDAAREPDDEAGRPHEGFLLSE